MNLALPDVDGPPPRRWIARGVALLLVVSLLSPAAAAAVSGGSNEPGELTRGTIASPANGTTVVAIQGFHFQGKGAAKKPARLVAVGPRGGTKWVFDGRRVGARWFYDVDPLPNGNLLVVSTNPSGTLVYELDPRTREQVWIEKLPIHDTHDVDRINDTHLVVANMRQWNESRGVSNDRVFIYDRRTDEATWEWTFREHYPRSMDGGFSKDWTHVNDVEVLEGNRLLLSPRNFDQVVVINRTTREITTRLGSDGAHDVLNEQHNPDYLLTEAGNPTILVADSENDRVVEYTRLNGTWKRVWEVGTGQLSWPRDADRLPNGNTLIVDSLNHRIIEVTPTGRIVWEYYATWGPYDAERVAHGDESNGPTMRDLGVSGSYQLSGSAGKIEGTGDSRTFAAALSIAVEGTPLERPGKAFARRWSHVTPWIRPVWLNSWDFAALVGAVLVVLVWGLAELLYNRRRLARGARVLRARVG